MKAFLLCTFMVFSFAMITGCQSAETMVLLDEEVREIKVSKSEGLGGINDEESFISFKDRKSIAVFEKAITSAVKQSGNADISKPKYDIAVEYKGELPSHGIHLWLGEDNEKSVFMYITDESVYLTSPEMTIKLRSLILSK
ncbi:MULTISPECIES: hypothetical protein [Cytobacillus]|uniref:YhfM-like domain-containing protein n=2 Tax=Cytobacillus TaxID=2675230 RepID=A0ABX3CZ90_9BACI|nr:MULTISPECIES: hypothetical protein [Cytobacillus]OHX50469.1 hypothetical protein BBV17_08395 [Cytobacillus oceanisediminis]QOK27213.1 hypothetical protein IIE26_00555 [Cytobacillus oceanisediminis]USK45428.1 hypothetical protein LIT27_06035 [Cytobacillus oceanisediminis]